MSAVPKDTIDTPQGLQGPSVALSEAQQDQSPARGTAQGHGKRKHLSGAEKRKRARLKAQGVELVPRPSVPSEQELMSLTGTAREWARLHRAWRLGQLTHGDYLIAIRGLSVGADVLTDVDQERQRQAQLRELAQIREQLERLQQQPHAPMLPAFDMEPDEPVPAANGDGEAAS